jgi:hypothetical protein
MSSEAQIIQRWDARIADILARSDELLGQAKTASEPLIEALRSDMGPLTQSWMAVEHRMHQHGEEVSEAWDEVSDELAEVDDPGDGLMDREGGKRDLTQVEIEIRFQRARIEVMARAAEKMRAAALATDARERRCTQCGAPLDRVKPVSQALNVECGYCASMNTIEPSHALRLFASSGSLYLGEREALEAWAAMRRAEVRIHQFRNARDVPLALLEEFEAAARLYWTTRLGVEAQYVPEDAKYLDTRLAARMKDVERTLRRHWQWRQRSGEGVSTSGA